MSQLEAVKPRIYGLSPEQVQFLREAVKKNILARDAARIIGVTVAQAQSWMTKIRKENG